MTDRPPLKRDANGASRTPLLSPTDLSGLDTPSSPFADNARPTFSARNRVVSYSSHIALDPTQSQLLATQNLRKKWLYASLFLVLSLVSFVVQTETAYTVQRVLRWEKAYCMLWLTHSSWTLLWPTQLLILRLQKRSLHQPWNKFLRSHLAHLRTTATMVTTGSTSPTASQLSRPLLPYVLRITAFVTTALTVAGGSWYVAIDLTTPADLTAIYNCSAFFAYAFSVPILKERLRLDKSVSVAIAIVGVLVVAYGPAAKSGHHAGGAVGPEPDAPDGEDDGEGQEAKNRVLGNVMIGIGSVLYGLYEVLYKKLACPPEGTSPGRSMIFANTVGSCIGCFTLCVLWIPIPVLHFTGLEVFELPTGRTAVLLLISVLANATFSGSFLILMSLTSPVLSSVAALLTIFIVAVTDWLLTGKPISAAALTGGFFIIVAFGMLSWATYREMQEESVKKIEAEMVGDDEDEEGMVEG